MNKSIPSPETVKLLPVAFNVGGEDLEVAIRGMLDVRQHFERAATICASLSEQLYERLDEIQIVNLDLAARAFTSIAQNEGEVLHRLAKIIDRATGMPQ